MINFKVIGRRIKNLRNEKGYTQEAFSEMLDISTEHLSRIETGSYRPSLGLIEKISEKLGITEEVLMFGDESDKGENLELADKIECLSEKNKEAIKIIIDLISE